MTADAFLCGKRMHLEVFEEQSDDGQNRLGFVLVPGSGSVEGRSICQSDPGSVAPIPG